MRKAKLVLAVVAICTVVGGALAFKAARNQDAVVYTHKPGDLATLCTVTVRGITTTINENPVELFATTTQTLPCVQSTFYITD